MTSTGPEPDSRLAWERGDAVAAPVAAAPPPRARRRWLWWLLAMVGLIVIIAIWQYPSFKAQAELGAAYGARVGCSCRYVQGRDMALCQSDFEPGMEIVTVEDDPAAKRVTGRVPFLAERTAHYAGASGCLLDPVVD